MKELISAIEELRGCRDTIEYNRVFDKMEIIYNKLPDDVKENNDNNEKLEALISDCESKLPFLIIEKDEN
jgi:hypothetical protein